MLGKENQPKAKKNGEESTRASDCDITRPPEATRSRGCSTTSDGEHLKFLRVASKPNIQVHQHTSSLTPPTVKTLCAKGLVQKGG